MEKAFSIVGKMEHDCGVKPVVGVLFLPEAACGSVLKNGQLVLKTLKGMGFSSAVMAEQVIPRAKTDAHTTPTLYYFINEPAPSCVFIERLTPTARKNGGTTMVAGEPLQVIPAVSGSIWGKYILRDDKRMPAPRKIITPASLSKKVIAR